MCLRTAWVRWGTTIPDITLIHKVSGGEDGYPDGFIGITRATSNDDPRLSLAHVVGGTAFSFHGPNSSRRLTGYSLMRLAKSAWPTCSPWGGRRATSCWLAIRASCLRSFRGHIPAPRTSLVSNGCWAIMRRFHRTEEYFCRSPDECTPRSAASFRIRSMKVG